jgi:hypothetical protein
MKTLHATENSGLIRINNQQRKTSPQGEVEAETPRQSHEELLD